MVTVFPTLSQQEARHLATKIRAHIANVEHHTEKARRKALTLYETESWHVLGYTSFKSCGTAEFARLWQQVYRLVDTAQVDANLASVSPTG